MLGSISTKASRVVISSGPKTKPKEPKTLMPPMTPRKSHKVLISALRPMKKGFTTLSTVANTRPQTLRHVVIPLLYPTIRLSVFFAIVGSLQLFDLVMPLTRGGPADSSNTLVSFLYNNGISRMRVGYGSAIGVILFVICVTFAFTYKRWFMRDE